MAPAGIFQFLGKAGGSVLTQLRILLARQQQRTPILEQRIQCFAQRMTAGARGCLAQTAQQGSQIGQLLQPLFEEFPVAIETVLLGQSLAAAQQVPGQCGKSVVQ